MDSIPSRTCTSCARELPLTEFYVDKRTGKSFSRCKPCYIERSNYPERFTEEAALRKAAALAAITAPTRVCTTCEIEKPVVDFEGTRKKCKACRALAVDKDAQSAAQARFRQAHKEEMAVKAKERYDNDPRYGVEKARKWRETHRATCVQYTLRHRSKNPDINTLTCGRRRARILQAPGAHTVAEWQALKEQYEFRCLACSRQEPEIKLTVDHVLPLTKGGGDDIDNIQPLCFSCNSKKNARHIDYRPVPSASSRSVKVQQLAMDM